MGRLDCKPWPPYAGLGELNVRRSRGLDAQE